MRNLAAAKAERAALLGQFARWPLLETPLAESLGFAADGSLAQLLERTEYALQGNTA